MCVCVCVCVLFSSLQLRMVSERLLGKTHYFVLHNASRKLPQRFLFETVPMFVWLTMAFSPPFKENSRVLPLSNASNLQAINGAVPLALCPQVVYMYVAPLWPVAYLPSWVRLLNLAPRIRTRCPSAGWDGSILSLRSGIPPVQWDVTWCFAASQLVRLHKIRSDKIR